ncbi:MAG: SusC/RagA family TonB-linked outer membrane protein [Chitinophagaceae bacterium]|nr:SusC/RagA family TonB-linked outer membrane protein [Chitinophagaceae bacterium]
MYKNKTIHDSLLWTTQKRLLVMLKLSVFLIFLNIAATFANDGAAQSVTLRADNITLLNAMKSIKKQTGLTYFLKGKDLANFRKDVDIRKLSLSQAMDQLVSGLPVDWLLEDGTIVLISVPPKTMLITAPVTDELSGQEKPDRMITGRVTDQNGDPLTGVSVVIKGTQKGTTTNEDGNYSISVGDDDKLLVFTMIGFVAKESRIAGNVVNITMQNDTGGLDEIVVTALGIKKEVRALGYSVTKVNNKEFSTVRENNFINSLEGKVAGVDIGGNVSNPGGSARVTIRGNTSIAGDNQPLYIINGIPMDNTKFGESDTRAPNWGDNISTLNAADIEEVTVLKGAAAAALYGSRAKNGAILITTKSGSGEKGFGIELTSQYTWEKPYFIYDEILQREYGQGIGHRRPSTVEDAARYNQRHWGEKLDGKMTIQMDGVERPYTYKKDELLDDLYSTGLSASNTIAFRNSSDRGSYRIALTDMKNDGIIQNFNIRRRNISLNTEQKILNNLSFNVSADYMNEKVGNRYFRNTQGGLPQVALMITNNMGPDELKPGYDENFQEIGVGTDRNATNPYFTLNRMSNHSSKDRFITALSAKWDVLSWLFVRGKVGQDFYTFGSENIIPDGTAFALNGYIELQDRKFWERNFELLISADRQINRDLSFNLSVGGNLMSQNSSITDMRGDGFQVPQLHILNNTNQRVTTLGGFQRKINSVFGLGEISYRDLLYVNVTGRNDWFSTLSPKSNNYFYPSVSGSFLFSEAFDLPGFIDFGKLRMSYASVGGDTDPYSLNLTYGFVGSLYNGLPLGTVNQTTVPNAHIRPLRVNEFEIGTEIRFLGDRLGLDLAFYNKLTKDDITQESISTTTGYDGSWVNVGRIRNKGVELLLYGTPVNTGTFRWNVSFNSSFNKSKVLQISEGADELVLGTSGAASFKQVAGMEYSQIAGRKILRNEDGLEIIDATGLPILSDDVVNFGSGVHRFIGGITNNFNYKNLTLSFLVDGKFGAKLFSATHAELNHRGMLISSLPGREDGLILPGVTEDGKPNTVLVTAERIGNRDIAQRRRDALDDWVFDASFIKLRNVSLTYDFSNKILQPTKFIKGASITFVGRNLWTILRHTPGIDPETNALSNNMQGLEDNALPPLRTFGVNINVKF